MPAVKLAKSSKVNSVTYVDVAGMNMEFAKFLFKKRGVHSKVRIMDAEKDSELIWSSSYDVILCIEVIEHVPEPKELLTKFSQCLRRGGHLVITHLRSEPTPDFPMHLKINFDAERFLLEGGFKKDEKYEWLWVKGGE